MRPTAWVSFLAVFLLTAAVCNSASKAHARARLPAAQQRLPSWVITSDWMSTEDEAVQHALDKAQAKVDDYLRTQSPPIEWPIDRTYLQQKLWGHLEASDPGFKALVKAPEDWQNVEKRTIHEHVVQVQTTELDRLGKVSRAAILVRISESARSEIEQQERAYQVKQRQDRAAKRQLVLVRLLAGLVAVLAAVACYFRLEDATKGYYTTLLRAAALTFVALVGAGIWLLM